MKRSLLALLGLTLVAAPAFAQQRTITGKVTSAQGKVTRAGVSLFGGHVYTIGARGDITITSTTATNRPFLDNTSNR
jgi:hypothetical protein